MAKQWTIEDLGALSVHDRATLFRNASRLAHTPEGSALKALLLEAGLPFSEEGMLSSDDPICLKMHDIIFSPEARDSAVAATKAGLPAMAGVDPLLQIALGVDYGPHNWGTVIAGSMVGEVMQSLGYRNLRQGKLPAGCVAKTAAMWG
jgi:hypothetical protein